MTRRNGFTLIELLIVVAIISLLAALVVPAANRAYVMSKRTVLRADLAAISIAIDAYQHDFGDIPRPDKFTANPFQGSVILSWALIAPGPAVYSGSSPLKFKGDGADGPGFRLRGTTGELLGPYLAPERFQVGTLDPTNGLRVVSPASGIFDDSSTFLGDRAGNVILYFPRKLKVTVTSLATYFGPLSASPAFVANDNDPGMAVIGPKHPFASIGRSGSGNPWAIQQFQFQMPGVVPDASGNPTLPDLTQTTKLSYLLWDCGPDGQFCTPDDVTNFGS